MVLNMPIIEKRNATEDKWYDEISDTSLDKSAAIGHQKEYCPQIYRETDYTPRENSLYKEVRKMTDDINYYGANEVFQKNNNVQITDNKNMVEIDNSVEKRLLQHMEKYVADVEHNETQAYNYATQIILNC